MMTTYELVGSVAVFRIPGDTLDASSTKEFKRTVAPMLEEQQEVVFDLSELKFVDSSGLGAILSCLRQMNGKSGRLVLCEMTKPVRALFELVRMHKIFDIFNTRDEAVASLRS